MDIESVVRFYAFLAVGAVASAGAFALAWIRSRGRVRELESQLADRADDSLLYQDVEEVRAGLDLLSEQMARLADGQSFLARVVSERRPDLMQAPEVSQVSTTPH